MCVFQSCWQEYLTARIEQNLVMNCNCPITDCQAQPTSHFFLSILTDKDTVAKVTYSLTLSPQSNSSCVSIQGRILSRLHLNSDSVTAAQLDNSKTSLNVSFQPGATEAPSGESFPTYPIIRCAGVTNCYLMAANHVVTFFNFKCNQSRLHRPVPPKDAAAELRHSNGGDRVMTCPAVRHKGAIQLQMESK